MADADSYTKEAGRHDPYGYARHFIVGAVGGVGMALLVSRAGVPAVPAALTGFVAAVVAGILGEIKDAYTGRGVVDWLDAAFTALGGLAAFLVLLIR